MLRTGGAPRLYCNKQALVSTEDLSKLLTHCFCQSSLATGARAKASRKYLQSGQRVECREDKLQEVAGGLQAGCRRVPFFVTVW
jgi:hypothetical protein